MRHLNTLKASVLLFSIILLFAACKSKTATEQRNIQLLTDTSVYKNNLHSDTAVIVKHQEINEGKKIPASTSITEEHSTHDKTGSVSSSISSNNTNSSTSSNTDNQDKGWSKAAKGAVIGGAAGAVGGAVISKKAGGAAIGAAVGAASGYIIGRDQDKQDGRVKRKKKH